MKSMMALFDHGTVRKFTAVFMAVVLVMGLSVPSASFAANEESQHSTSSSVVDLPAPDAQTPDVQAQDTQTPNEQTPDKQAEDEQNPEATAETSADIAAADHHLASKSEEGQLSPQSEDDWANVEDTFTVEAIQQFIPDPAFAQAVYDSISSAIQNDEYQIDKAAFCDPLGYTDKWPEPITIEDMLDEGTEGDDLVIALLRNYVGPIFAERRGVKDITGFQYLKNATSVNLSSNNIEDLTPFTGYVMGGAFDFHNNPIHIWPKTLANTVRSGTHGFSTYYQVTTAPLAYRFGETVTPTLTYDVYYPDKDTLNNEWYTKFWINTSAYGDTIPAAPQANGAGGITLPPLTSDGRAILEIGLTGLKQIEDYDRWQDCLENAVQYTSGMSTNETGGNVGQGNSPSYQFGVAAQRYATVNITDETKVTGGFTFTKTSSTSGEPVAGAEYTLYANNGVTVVGGPYTTDDKGVIEEGGFAPGTYILKETKAANGYTINTDPITITISDPGSKTSVTGGVASFEHDDLNPNVQANWGAEKASNSGVWNKTTDTTHETAETYNADALLTNKGNVGYKVLSSLTAEFNGGEETYEGTDEIIVSMGGETYGTYTSEASALAAINGIVNGKKLTGDITVEYKGVYAEKAGHYTATGAQTDTPLPVNLSFNATKTFDGTLSGVQGAFGNFEFTATGTGEDGATLTGPVYNDGDGKVSFGGLSFSKPGTYEFTFAETQGSDPDTQYTSATHKVKVIVVDGADGLSAQVVVDGTVVGTYTGTGTNTVDAIGTVTAKPTDIDVGTFANHLMKPTVTLSASKSVDLGSLAAGQFTFSLVPGADCTDVTYLDATQTEHPLPAGGWAAIGNKADGTIDFDTAFSALAFPRAEGTYHFTLTENDTPAGSAYNKDATSVPITVTVTKNATTGKFETAVAYDGSATAPEFENTFKRTTLTASKIVAAGGSTSDEFEFTLTFDAGTSGLTLPATGIAGITLGAGNTATITKVNGTAASTIGATDSVLSVTYTVKGGEKLVLAGVPVGLGYTVAETSNANYYDNTDRTGTVEAAGSSVSVSNQVKTGDVYVSKAVSGLHSSADDTFTFTMSLDIKNGYTWTTRTYNISQDGGLTWGPDETVDAGATTLSFYLKDGWVARVNKLPVGTYTTVETEDGTYTASPALEQEVRLDQNNIDNEEGAKLDFTNTKKSPTPTAVVLAAAKTVDGNVPQTITNGFANGAYTTAPFAGAFSFTLSQTGTLPLGAATPTGTSQTKTNGAAGAVTFDAIGNLTAEGDYTFQVTETTTDTAYVDADGSTYNAVVHVAYNAKADSGNKDYAGTSVTTPNSLYVDKITWTKDGAAATSAAFDNKTIKPASIKANLEVTKTLDGTVPKAGAFSFTVTAADGTPMPANVTASNFADGTVEFGDIEFSAPGTYTYTIVEKAPADETVAKDLRSYEAVVTVTDDGTNTLSAAVTYTASAATDITGAASATDSAAFVNRTYAPSYSMAKFRTADAPEFGDTGTFGFAPGSKGVIYKIAVVNTGELALTMDVNDAFTTGATNFENVKFTAGTGYTGKAFATTDAATLAGITTIEAAASDSATLVNSGLNTDTVNVTIQPGSTIVLTVTADVTDAAKALLDNAASDDASNPKTNTHGYTNTAKTTEVTATYTSGETTVTLTKDDFPAGSEGAMALDDETDTAQTPVQPTVGYTMSKTRVTTAPAQEGTDKFGFFHGDTVTYSVEIQNTGNTPLTMLISDAFTDTTYFSTPTATAVNGTGVTTTTTLPTTDPVNVSIPAGKTATVTFTADVDDSALENLSDTADDKGMGYVNTATTTDVKAIYTDPDGTETTADDTDFPDELGDKEDTAATPVQKAVGTSVAIPVTKTISGGTPVVDDTFTFTLAAQTAGAPMPAVTTASVTGAGEGLFDSIAYMQAGTYEYTITENVGTNGRYTYDDSSYTYTVVVTEVNGRLQADESIAKGGTSADKNEFTNNYNDEPGKPNVEKIGKTTPANAGDELSWDIVVENPEDFDIYGVWVKDVAPEYTTLTSAVGDVEGKVVTEGTTQYATWFVPVLKAGQTVTLTLKATVNADVPDGTAVSNVAHFQVTGDTDEPEDTSLTPGESTNKVETPAINAAVPSAVKKVSPVSPLSVFSPSAKTGDDVPIVPITVVLLVGGALAFMARRRLSK